MAHAITVIGGGNGAFATAADLTMRGFRVALYELPQFESNISDAAKLGGINLEALPSSGVTAGFARIETITTDIKKALYDAEVIMVVVPSFGQEAVARICAPYLQDGQIVLLAPGNFGASIAFHQCLIEGGCRSRVHIAEAECMMYACRKNDSTTIWLRGNKKRVALAAFPASSTDHVLRKIREIDGRFVKSPNVLVTGLSNANTILHLPIMLANISNAENKADVLFYGEGLTPAVGRIMDKMDEERMGAATLGIDLQPMLQIVSNFYRHQGAMGDTLWELMRNNPIFPTSKMPDTLSHRYLTEDIPFGAIPMLNLLEKFGLPNKTIKMVIDLLCLASGLDFNKDVRDLKKLGLDGLSAPELLEFVNFGRTV